MARAELAPAWGLFDFASGRSQFGFQGKALPCCRFSPSFKIKAGVWYRTDPGENSCRRAASCECPKGMCGSTSFSPDPKFTKRHNDHRHDRLAFDAPRRRRRRGVTVSGSRSPRRDRQSTTTTPRWRAVWNSCRPPGSTVRSKSGGLRSGDPLRSRARRIRPYHVGLSGRGHRVLRAAPAGTSESASGVSILQCPFFSRPHDLPAIMCDEEGLAPCRNVSR
jgi:hypothetical protein